MALIEKFESRPIEPTRIHSGVVCGHRAVELDGRWILQLETYGTKERQQPEKVSQVIQLDQAAAMELMQIIRSAFPGLSPV